VDDPLRQTRPTRRGLLRHGLASVAAAVGLAQAPAAAAAATGRRSHRHFTGRNWHANVFRPGAAGGRVLVADRGDTVAMWGVVYEGGRRVGEFYSAATVVFAPLSATPAASFEHHSFTLHDGSIFGTGTVPAHPKGTVTFAVTGGTGAYAGASGTYTARQHPAELGGDGTAAFSLDLLLPGRT
jgi:hypothetical protein